MYPMSRVLLQGLAENRTYPEVTNSLGFRVQQAVNCKDFLRQKFSDGYSLTWRGALFLGPNPELQTLPRGSYPTPFLGRLLLR